jgi:hypothetical protein
MMFLVVARAALLRDKQPWISLKSLILDAGARLLPALLPIKFHMQLDLVLSQTSNVAYAPGDRGGCIIYLLPAFADVATAVPSR